MRSPSWVACIALVLLVACAPIEALSTPSPLPPTASPTPENKEPAFVSSSDLFITSNYPTRVSLHVIGDLPTPCNQFRADVAPPNAQKNIQVSVYSVVTTDAMCAQVLKPFDEIITIDMRDRFDGTYTVYLNDEPAGQIIVEGNRVSAVSQ